MDGDNDNTVGDVVEPRGAKAPATERYSKAANSDDDGTESGTCQAEQMDGERGTRRGCVRKCFGFLHTSLQKWPPKGKGGGG